MTFLRSVIPLYLSVEHDLFGKPVPTFPDHALMIIFPRAQTSGGAQYDERRIFLVFGGRVDLLLGQFQRDAVAFVRHAAEMQRAPVDDDFPAADAEEAAEIDHGSTHGALAIHDHIDDASHILIARAANIAAENAMRVPRA